MVAAMKLYVGNIGVALSQLLNALIGGDPDETICSRVGKRLRDDNMTPWAWFIVFITSRQHVAGAVENDEGKSAVFKDSISE